MLKPKRIWRTPLTITLLTSCKNRTEIGRKLKERFSKAQREDLRYIPKLITEDHNKVLGKAIEILEVEMAVNQMVKDKAPGLDGFTSNFFHVGW